MGAACVVACGTRQDGSRPLPRWPGLSIFSRRRASTSFSVATSGPLRALEAGTFKVDAPKPSCRNAAVKSILENFTYRSRTDMGPKADMRHFGQAVEWSIEQQDLARICMYDVCSVVVPFYAYIVIDRRATF